MLYQQRTNLGLLIFALIVLSSCRKSNDDNRVIIQNFTQDIRDYFLFSRGTYWVYENNKTQELDSIYVIDIDTTLKVDHYHVPPIEYKEIKITTTRRYNNKDEELVFNNFYFGYGRKYDIVNENSSNPGIRYSIWRDATYSERALIYRSHSYVGDTYDFIADNGDTKQLIYSDFQESIVQNSETFKNVVTMTNEYDKTYNYKGQKVIYTLAKDIGIIKITIVDTNTEWVLKRYHVVK